MAMTLPNTPNQLLTTTCVAAPVYMPGVDVETDAEAEVPVAEASHSSHGIVVVVDPAPVADVGPETAAVSEAADTLEAATDAFEAAGVDDPTATEAEEAAAADSGDAGDAAVDVPTCTCPSLIWVTT